MKTQKNIAKISSCWTLIILLLAGCGSEAAPAAGPLTEVTLTPAVVMTQTSEESVPLASPISTPLPVTITTAATYSAAQEPSPDLSATPPAPTAPAVMTALPATVPAAAESLSFAVIGDYGGSGQGTQDVAALVDRWDPDLVLTVGDNNYPDGAAYTIEGNITQHYGRFIAEGRFFPTLGNHDMTTENGQPYIDYFDLPGNERYYDFVRGDVHFFALNSDWREPDGIKADSKQAQWLQEQLAASTAVWQVVYLHVPPYVSMTAKEVPVLRWPFAAWGADLVLSGHAHLYERLEVDGIPYVVNGLGGTAIYPFDEEARAASKARYNDDYGALLVEATSDELQLQFVTRQGNIVDRHALKAD